jgi:hypothetical protein
MRVEEILHLGPLEIIDYSSFTYVVACMAEGKVVGIIVAHIIAMKISKNLKLYYYGKERK